MPRKKRVWYPGAVYYVMNRANRRVVLYKDEDDYYSFIESVQITSKIYQFRHWYRKSMWYSLGQIKFRAE
ncbi:MAG: hypothetical protein K6G27_06235 [Lachnospiraceae bacterium]|nr:hypothetical protein [Lachnospiraceae bacterium]